MFFPNLHTHFRTSNPYSILNSYSSIDIPHSRGIHPWYIESNNQEQLKILEDDLVHPKCIAIGEAGLDRLSKIDFDIQINIFKRQIMLSEKYQLPLIIHCVKASNELFQLKKELNPTQTWIWHGFNKTNLLKQTIENEIIPSFGEVILDQELIQNELSKLNISQFLLESDISTISIESIYKKVALIRKQPILSIQKEQLINFERIFTKWQIG